MKRSFTLVATAVMAGSLLTALPAQAKTATYDITTLAGKIASLRGSAGLQLRFSAFLEEESNEAAAAPTSAPIAPDFVLSSPLDGTSVQPPDVTVNQDAAAAPQNETAIAVDPTNPNVLLAGANDYVTRTWSCTVNGSPCSALGDGYSGTYLSTDGGHTWCCTATDPNHLGTLIPGVEHLTGGPYDAGGDPSVAFDSQGTPYYAGLGFDRTSAPNTVTVSRGSIDGGSLTWGAPTFIGATKSPATLNDKEWIAVDTNAASPFRDRIYVSWTRYVFNANNGTFKQAPIFFASSSDGGATFSAPKAISGNVLYDQGSRPIVGPDGTLYVFWDGSTRLQSLDSTWMAKSTDGGATWSTPTAVSKITDMMDVKDTVFRNNSFPAAAAAPNGDLYATWTTETKANDPNLAGDARCASWLSSDLSNCVSVAVYSKSTNGGSTWSAPARVFADANRVPLGYPVPQPSGGVLNAPDPSPVEDVFPSVAVAPDGHVYLSAYRGDVVSPWQTCAAGPPPPVGRITCTTLGDYIDNTRLDYVVADLTTGVTQAVNTHPINTRYGFGGGFFGDYTDIAVGSDSVMHALWTDSNNVQTVEWFYGVQFVPTHIHQQDAATVGATF